MNTIVDKNLESISYAGKVDIKVLYKDKVIKEKIQKNHGYLSLFKFLCYCLQGNYTIADRLIPNKIKFFGENSYLKQWKEDHENYKGLLDGDVSLILENGALHSNFIYTSKYPTMDLNENSVKTILHFSLNSRYLSSDGICIVALYGANTTNELEPAAVVILTNDDQTELEPIKFDEDQANNIVVDWTLQFNSR